MPDLIPRSPFVEALILYLGQLLEMEWRDTGRKILCTIQQEIDDSRGIFSTLKIKVPPEKPGSVSTIEYISRGREPSVVRLQAGTIIWEKQGQKSRKPVLIPRSRFVKAVIPYRGQLLEMEWRDTARKIRCTIEQEFDDSRGIFSKLKLHIPPEGQGSPGAIMYLSREDEPSAVHLLDGTTIWEKKEKNLDQPDGNLLSIPEQQEANPAEFVFLRQYVVTASNDQYPQKHSFYPLKHEDIVSAEKRIRKPFPAELRRFYEQIGYGLMAKSDESDINRLMGPDSVADFHRGQGVYEGDPVRELYRRRSRLVFFELFGGVYLTLDVSKQDAAGCCPVYYFSEQIAVSLGDFLKRMDEKPNYFVK